MKIRFCSVFSVPWRTAELKPLRLALAWTLISLALNRLGDAIGRGKADYL